jgi:hypothetical protein
LLTLEVADALATWRDVAREVGIPRAEQQRVGVAFSALGTAGRMEPVG